MQFAAVFSTSQWLLGGTGFGYGLDELLRVVTGLLVGQRVGGPGSQRP
jgi:hypothetical protein